MEKLPTEVITHIMQFLPLKDRKSCALVCRKWYSAVQDRNLSSKLFCRLRIFEEPEKCREIARCAHRRSITHLSICSCSPGYKNGKFQNSSSAWYEKEGMFWNTISDQFEMITTVHLANFGHTDLMEEILSNFATLFPSVNTLKLEAGVLFDVTKSTVMRKKVLSGLEKIQQLIVLMGGERYCSDIFQCLMELNLNIHYVLVEDYDFVISKVDEETVTYFRRNYYSKIPLSVLTFFCSNLGCEVHFECINVNLPELQLPEVVTELRSIPKLITKCLNVKHCSISITDDKNSYLNQISEFGLTSLCLQSPCYVHNWLSKEFLPSVILKWEALKTIECLGRFDKTTLHQLFSYFPFPESVHALLRQRRGRNIGFYIEYMSIKVSFRTTLNGPLRTISLTTSYQGVVSFTPPCFNTGLKICDIVSALPLHLQEFEIIVNELDKGTLLNMIDLRKRCPTIRKVKVGFSTSEKNCDTYMSQPGEMGKTEGLELHPNTHLNYRDYEYRVEVFKPPPKPEYFPEDTWGF